MTEAEKFWKKRAMAAERAIVGHQIAAKELKGQIRLLTAERDILARQLRGGGSATGGSQHYHSVPKNQTECLAGKCPGF